MNKRIEQFFKKIVSFFHIRLTDSQLKNFLQFIKFGIVGLSNTTVSYGVNIFVLFVMKPLEVPWDFIMGNVIAFVLSVLWSFYWNNRFVFTTSNGMHRKIGRTLLKTFIAYGFTGIALNNILSWIWISVLKISKYVAPLINLIISVPLNFVINKFWTFNEKPNM